MWFQAIPGGDPPGDSRTPPHPPPDGSFNPHPVVTHRVTLELRAVAQVPRSFNPHPVVTHRVTSRQKPLEFPPIFLHRARTCRPHWMVSGHTPEHREKRVLYSMDSLQREPHRVWPFAWGSRGASFGGGVAWWVWALCAGRAGGSMPDQTISGPSNCHWCDPPGACRASIKSLHAPPGGHRVAG